MDLYAVFGNPVSHSKSPLIFNNFFKATNLNANYFRVLTFSAKNVFTIIKRLKINGANITSPYKTDIVEFLDDLSDNAKNINAVNTIKRSSDKFIGYNTDFYSVVKIIESLNLKKTLVLGAGGAAISAIYALKNLNVSVTILNRIIKKAETLSKIYNCKFDSLKNIKNYKKKFDVIINTISDNNKFVNDNFFKKNQVFIDANYKDSPYFYLKNNSNVKYFDGNIWLINQALEAFKIFTELAVKNNKQVDFKFDYTKILLLGDMGKKISKTINNPIFVNDYNKNSSDKYYIIQFVDLTDNKNIDLNNIDLLIDITDKSLVDIIDILNKEMNIKI